MCIFALLLNVASCALIITTFAGNGTAGSGGDSGPAIAAQLSSPINVAIDTTGNIFVAESGNDLIRKIDTQGIITTYFSALLDPTDVAVDAAGNIYVADNNNHTVVKIDPSKQVTIIAGISGQRGYGQDGVLANTTTLNNPRGVTLDQDGNIYIADANNNRVRKVDTSGIISTVAGTGVVGATGDGGAPTNATLNLPSKIAFGPNGAYYIADLLNSRVRVVRNGIITTFAGTGAVGYNGDGINATTAMLAYPRGVAVDATGNVYIADVGNNRVRVVNTTGFIRTFAGNGYAPFAGDGGDPTKATVNSPAGVTLDSSGKVYIADQGNNRIRLVHDPTAASSSTSTTATTSVSSTSSATQTAPTDSSSTTSEFSAGVRTQYGTALILYGLLFLVWISA